MEKFNNPAGDLPARAEPALEPPDSFHVSSAHGWMDFGQLHEAALDLDKVAARWGEHPEVLEARVELETRRKDWKQCAEIAGRLIARSPQQASGWIHRSYALHELKQTREAWTALRPVADRFPEVWIIPYNLACYACQLGWMDEAKIWLGRAMETGDPKEVCPAAWNDPDLAPLMEQWP